MLLGFVTWASGDEGGRGAVQGVKYREWEGANQGGWFRTPWSKEEMGEAGWGGSGREVVWRIAGGKY